MEKKYTFEEVKKIFEKRNEEKGIKKQGEDKNPLYCCLVYKQEDIYEDDDLDFRTFIFRSDEPYFIKDSKRKTIISSTKIKSEVNIRLDLYLEKEKHLIDYCLIKKNGNE